MFAACAPESATPCDVWLPESHPLYEAQQAWGLPLPFAPKYVEISKAQIGNVCGYPGQALLGCSEWQSQIVYVQEGVSSEALAETKLHELGHFIATAHVPYAVHLPVSDECPAEHRGQHVMCAGGLADRSGGLTDADFDFVLGL